MFKNSVRVSSKAGNYDALTAMPVHMDGAPWAQGMGVCPPLEMNPLRAQAVRAGARPGARGAPEPLSLLRLSRSTQPYPDPGGPVPREPCIKPQQFLALAAFQSSPARPNLLTRAVILRMLCLRCGVMGEVCQVTSRPWRPCPGPAEGPGEGAPRYHPGSPCWADSALSPSSSSRSRETRHCRSLQIVYLF